MAMPISNSSVHSLGTTPVPLHTYTPSAMPGPDEGCDWHFHIPANVSIEASIAVPLSHPSSTTASPKPEAY